ncbi:hypothetical protein RRG08_051578, partial [Elysia crispata]
PSKLERQRNLARMLSRKTDLEKGRDIAPKTCVFYLLSLQKGCPKTFTVQKP